MRATVVDWRAGPVKALVEPRVAAGDPIRALTGPARHAGSAAGPGAGHDVGKTVAVDVAGRHGDPAPEADVVREEGAHHLPGRAVEDLDVRPAAGAGPGDDVRQPVAGHVPRRHAHAPRER